MRRSLRRIVVPVLILLLLAVLAWRGGGQGGGRLIDAEGRRIFVADGDTFKVWGETIRLAGMDAVERGQFCIDARGVSWSCGQSAREALEQVMAEGSLRCSTVEKDRYGRTVARCRGARGDIAAAMVAQGWAVSDGPYDTQETAAREAHRGIWAGTFEAPAVWRERNRVAPKQADLAQ
ncbi:MAG TPA: thermonuclease family protein [Sphingobium sp.]